MSSFLAIETVTKDTIYHKFINDAGEKVEEFVNFQPFVGVDSLLNDTKYKTMFNKPIDIRNFSSISDFRSWKKDNEGILKNIYGDVKIEHMFLAHTYPETIKYNWELLNIFNYDIEVLSEEGFPSPDEVKWPVTSIAVENLITKKYTLFAWKNYEHRINKDVNFIYCEDEADLLRKFIKFWKQSKVDVLTGWNIVGFDVPYMVNRVKRILGKKAHEDFSNIGVVKPRKFTDDFDNEVTTYEMAGVIIYDYLDLYKKFNLEPRDGYSLEVIAQAELGKGKLDYKNNENRTLNELWAEDPQLYMEYNIEDTSLVGELDDKLQFIRLALTLTYMTKCEFKDVFGTVGIWDAFLYNELLAKNILCPPRKSNVKSPFPGGWVKDPIRGKHGWNMVFDIASSYPNSKISYNISPECIIEFDALPKELRQVAEDIKPSYDAIENSWMLSEKAFDIDWLEKTVSPLTQKYDVCLTPFGQYFRRDKIGIIPEVVDRVFQTRKKIKKEMKGMSGSDFVSANAHQGALKVLMNSVYGALSNIYFRYFDIRMAGSITCAGQTSVKGSEKYLQERIDGMVNYYIDTDSIFLNMQNFVDKRFKNKKRNIVDEHDFCMKLGKEVVSPLLTEFFDRLTKSYNTVRNTLSMDSEALADKWIIVEKKRYTMRIINDEGTEYFNRETGEIGKWNHEKTVFTPNEIKLKTRGLSLIQSVTPAFARGKLKKSIQLIFELEDQAEVKDLFDSWKKEFMTLPFHEVGMPRSVTTFNKYIHNEFGAQAHVRAALTFNRVLEERGLADKYQQVHQGDKIRFCYLKTPNKFQSDVIAVRDKMPEELMQDVKIDWNTQWEKCFTSQLEKIFTTIGWNVSEDAVSLEDFF